MRTIIELDDTQVQRLDAWARAQQLSRAEAVRRAVQQLLDQAATPAGQGFGLWLQAGPLTPERDGLAIERSLRDEWPE